MSKSDFSNVDTEIPTAPVETQNMPAVQADSQVVTDDFFSNSGFDGEFDRKEVRTPYLSLVHGVGDLSKLGYLPGSIVYNKETVVAIPTKGTMAPEAGCNITVLGGFKEYIEKITDDEFKAGVKARRYSKEADARKDGLITSKEAREAGDEEAKTFYPALQVKVLVKGKPEFGFGLEFEGETYALAALGLGKGSYWGAGITLFNFTNDAKMMKRPNCWANFQLFSKNETFKGSPNSTWSLKAQKGTKNTDAFVAWVKEMKF